MGQIFIFFLLTAVCTAQIRTPSQTRAKASKRAPQSGGPGCCSYYVSQSTGSDSNPGTLALPWQTIAKVNAQTFLPGQSIGFKAGDTWRPPDAAFVPTNSGSGGSPITYTSYGSGAQPKITGAALLNSGWTASGTITQQDSYTTLNTPGSLNIDFNTSAQKGAGQFTAGSSYSVSQVTLQLEKVGAPTGTITVSIFNDNGSNNVGASDLGDSGTLNTASLTTSYLSYTFVWSTPVALTSGTKYWIVVAPSGGVSSTNYVNLREDSAAAGHYQSRWNGTTWTATSGQQTYFIAYSLVLTPNVWQASLTATTTYVLFNGVQGTIEPSIAALTGPLEWYSAASILYVYSTSNPATAYTAPGVEAAQDVNSLASTASYLTFNGLDLSMGNSYANVIFGSNSGANIIVENCTIHDTNQTGLYFWGTQNGLAQNNTVYNVWNGGTHAGGGTGNGITVYGSNAVNNRITQNTITTSYRGVFIYGAGSNPLGTLIDHNVIVTPYINGIDQFQTNAASNPTKIYNNTIIFSPFSGTGGQAGHGFDIQDTGSDGWDARNNLVYATYSGTPTDVECVNISSSITLTTINIDYNDYFLASGSSSYIAQDNSGNKYSTLGTWQTFLLSTTYTGKDVHSISADPLFVNFSAGNFNLQPGSPAISAGIYIPGVSTANPPNIGAK